MRAFFKKTRIFLRPVIMLLFLIIPIVLINILRGMDTYDEVYKSWSAGDRFAHISLLLSDKAEFGDSDVKRMRSELEEGLKMDNVLKSENGTISFIDCYSAKGKVSVDTGTSETECLAYGVGGKFFMFHPFRLVSGSYFSDENVMDDLIVIDEDLAWQLFGSTDIVGMEVVIQENPFIVSGVIKRDSGIFNKAAGNSKTAIYMSYSAFSKYNEVPVSNYEVIMPDLTEGYAKRMVRAGAGLGDTSMVSGVEKYDLDDRELVEVSGRYSYSRLFGVIRHLGNRAMHRKAIEYPFWENKSRAIELICAVLFMIFIIELVIAAICVVIVIIRFYIRNKEKIYARMLLLRSVIKIVIVRVKNKVMGRKIDTVILDIGMVLVEFMPEKFLRNVGINEDKINPVLNAVVDNEIWNEYDKGIMTEDEALDKFIERRPMLEPEIRKAFDNLNGIVKRYPYTDGFIQILKSEGYRVLYLSNLSEKLYNECESELDFVNDMDGGVFSFEVRMKKPDKDIYEYMIEKFDLTPEKCVFIDDREVNLRAAGELGFRTILFDDYETAMRRISEI